MRNPKAEFYIVLILTVLLISICVASFSRMYYSDIFPVIIACLGLLLFLFFGRLFILYLQEIKTSALTTRILNNMPVGIALLNRYNRFSFTNELASNHYAHLQNNEKIQDVLSKINTIAQGGRSAEDTQILSDKDGNEHVLRIVGTNIPNTRQVVCAFIDVTKALNEINDKSALADFLDQSPLGFFSINEDGQFLYCNKVAIKYFGLESKNFTSVSISEKIDNKHIKLLPAELDHKKNVVHEHKVSIKNAPYRIVQRVVVTNGKKITCSIIMPQKRDRNFKSAHAHNYREVFDDVPAGLAVLNNQGEIENVNHSFTELMGTDRKKIIKTSFMTWLNNTSQKEFQRSFEYLLTDPSKHAKPIEINFLGKRESAMSLHMSPLVEDDEINGAILLLIDMSEHKKLELQFVHSQRMQAIGQLAGGVAHDFNNLLTAMIGFCDLLLERHSPAEQTFSDVQQIKQNGQRAANLVKQLLAFSRQQALQPKILNIADALSELSALLRRLLGSAIQLKVSHSREIGFVRVDQGQLEQVIVNLAVNARDAMQEQGTLNIRTNNVKVTKEIEHKHETIPQGEYVLLQVEDTGAGIPDEIIDRIFEPFFSTKEIGSGTGLGLSMVHGIVHQTGGYIIVDSKAGKGTTFSIYLPRFYPENDEQKESKKKIERDLTGTEKILLVEDEDAVRLFSSRALREKGYEVIEASSGEIGYEKFMANQDIDLIITDVVMPKMDGPTLITNIRKTNQSMKVIFISGYTEDSFRNKLSVDENIHFLAKPFNLKDLAAKVKEVL